MSAKFYTLMTDIGAAKLASAAALGIPLKITQMAVGDGGGALPTPDAKQTALVAEKRRAALNMLYIDPQNSSQIIAEQVIPETEGGWWIREVGLFDETGALIAVGNCPESYKPQLVEGSGRTQTVRMVLITSSTDNITLKIDPSVVLATRSYVDNLIETRQQKSDTLTALAELKPAKGKFPYFTAEKAAALADLSDYIRLMLGKADAAGVLEYLGLSEGAPMIGTPIPWPSEIMPSEIFPHMANMVFLKHNGAPFDPDIYPLLGKVYPDGVIIDLRGEFIRGWDDGRGVDSGRTLLSWQKGSYLVQERESAVDNIVQFSLNTLALLGWDKSENNGDLIRAKAIQATSTWTSAPSNSDGIQYMGYARPRNIAFNYIVRAA
ncbi:phage tail protein [Kluyvera georgiana]|uniref:phage tail protein n=1 Tax=Kluyvera georgiana TaxID=73098 RepID=UPI0032201AB2